MRTVVALLVACLLAASVTGCDDAPADEPAAVSGTARPEDTSVPGLSCSPVGIHPRTNVSPTFDVFFARPGATVAMPSSPVRQGIAFVDRPDADTVQYVIGTERDPRGSSSAEIRDRVERYGGSAVIRDPLREQVVRVRLDRSIRSGVYFVHVAYTYEPTVDGCSGLAVYRAARLVVSDAADLGEGDRGALARGFPGGSSVRFRLDPEQGVRIDGRGWHAEPASAGSLGDVEGRLTRINCALVVFQPDVADVLVLLRPDAAVAGCRYTPDR